jgi:hypothetical protein
MLFFPFVFVFNFFFLFPFHICPRASRENVRMPENLLLFSFADNLNVGTPLGGFVFYLYNFFGPNFFIPPFVL